MQEVLFFIRGHRLVGCFLFCGAGVNRRVELDNYAYVLGFKGIEFFLQGNINEPFLLLNFLIM